MRLESFLFTKQAIEQARAHLKPDGVFGMYNYYRAELARSIGTPARSTKSSVGRRASNRWGRNRPISRS